MALRAASVAAQALAVGVLAVVTTDGGSSWPRRLALLAALAPVAGGLGALAAVRLASARGELRALAAVGVSPARASRGAVVAGTLVGILGAVALATGQLDLDALLPRLPASTWVLDESGAVVARHFGLRLTTGGELGLASESAAAAPLPLPLPSALGLAGAVLVAALAAPVWAVGSSSGRRAALVGVATALLAIVTFHAVAAGLARAGLLAAAPLVLLVDVLAARYRRDSR